MGEGVAVDDAEVDDQHLDAQVGQEQRVSTTFFRCWWVVGVVVGVEAMQSIHSFGGGR